MKIKVDYSEEVKKSGNRHCPGEFAIYIKRHWWSKWIQLRQTYASLAFAFSDAKKMGTIYLLSKESNKKARR